MKKIFFNYSLDCELPVGPLTPGVGSGNRFSAARERERMKGCRCAPLRPGRVSPVRARVKWRKGAADGK